MRRFVVHAIVLVLVPLALCGHVLVKSADDPALPIAEAERAFAARSLATNMKEAFVAWLADDGIVFRPLPVVGKPIWEARPVPQATLAWEPQYAEMAYSGDLGWDYGPSEIRFPADANQPTIHGHFFSVWKKLPDGQWRVACDIGVSHAAPDSDGVGSNAYVPGPVHRAPGRDAARASSAHVYRDLDRTLGREGTVPRAITRHAASDVRIGTEGAMPMTGVRAARAALDSLRGKATWRTHAGGVSGGRDLAWSCGVLERATAAAPDTMVYLNVWRRARGGPWKLALAVMNPVE
jgi:ketosteroid isomerase-like protein